MRQGDDQWFNIVRWVHLSCSMLKNSISISLNVDEQPNLTTEIKRLRYRAELWRAVRRTKTSGYRVIKQVGNYAEVFDRNLGQGSQLKITRGLNALWTKGGIQYGPPVR